MCPAVPGCPSQVTPGLSPQGPKGESVGSITQPLPSSYLIFRAASESDGESPPALQGSPVTPRDMGTPANLHTRCPWPLFRPSHCPPRRRRPDAKGQDWARARQACHSTRSYLPEPQFPQSKT